MSDNGRTDHTLSEIKYTLSETKNTVSKMEQYEGKENQNIYIARIKNGIIPKEPKLINQNHKKINILKQKEKNQIKGSLIIPLKRENNKNMEPIIVARTEEARLTFL